MKHCRALPLIAALAIAPIDSAHAASYASATLSLIEVTLTDHDLDDGMAASMALLEWAGGGPSHARVWFTTLDEGKELITANVAPAPWTPVSAHAVDGADTVAIGTVGGLALDSLMLSASAVASAGNLQYVDGYAYTGYRYRLSPNTSATFTFDMGVDAHNVAGHSYFSDAYASVIMAYANSSVPIYWFGSRYRDHFQAGRDDGQPGRERFTRTMRAGDGPQEFVLSMSANVHVDLLASPVPEAQPWTMLLAGLALAAAHARRRARAGA